MLSARGHHRNDNHTATISTPPDALFAPAQGTLPCNAANSRSPAVRRSRTEYQGIENVTATAEEGQMAAEGAAIVEAEAVKIAAGAAATKKSSKIPNTALRPLAPTAISV